MSGRRERGFTLVEAIVVMVVTSILAGIMVLFIRRPVQSYIDSTERADMADVADIALRRMARELRSAVPNSIRWQENGTTTLLEFIPTKAGGMYLSEDQGAPAPNVPLSFTDLNSLNFSIVGTVPAAPYAIAPGDSIVIYNLGNGIDDADAYVGGNRGTVTNVAGNLVTIRDPNSAVPRNPFAVPAFNGRVPNSSPGKRFNVATAPVTFMCVNDTATGRGTLRRYWNYGFRAAQTDPSTLANTPNALMAANVYACRFSVMQMANQHTALIGISIALARSSPGVAANGLETVTLTQQIHVANIP